MILFDENLSRKLPAKLQSYFGECLHVIELHLEHTDDHEVWKLAKEKGFTIISKDSDFYNLLMKFGHPPKIIWLRMGNASTKEIEKMLISIQDEIKRFLKDNKTGLLEIY